MNAQNQRFREEIVRVFDTLHESPEVRAVVLTGEGRVFSAGADLKERPGSRSVTSLSPSSSKRCVLRRKQ